MAIKRKTSEKKAKKKPDKSKSDKKLAESRKKESEKNTIKALFTGENVISNTKEAISLYSQSRFGELKQGKIVYSIVEALYLIEKKKMTLYFDRKKLNFEKLIDFAKQKNKRIRTKYLVFRDMRNRGFIVKTALKFGAEFRIYARGIKPGEDHAKWILYPVSENQELTWHDFSAKNRVAHSTKKNLLIGIVDEEEDVTYYEISWTKP